MERAVRLLAASQLQAVPTRRSFTIAPAVAKRLQERLRGGPVGTLSLAIIAARFGRPDISSKLGERAFRQRPVSPATVSMRLRQLYAAGEQDESLALLRRLDESVDLNAPAQQLRAHLVGEAGQREEELRRRISALASAAIPEVSWLHLLGVRLLRVGDHHRAVIALRPAAMEGLDRSGASRHMGDALRLTTDQEVVEAYLDDLSRSLGNPDLVRAAIRRIGGILNPYAAAELRSAAYANGLIDASTRERLDWLVAGRHWNEAVALSETALRNGGDRDPRIVNAAAKALQNSERSGIVLDSWLGLRAGTEPRAAETAELIQEALDAGVELPPETLTALGSAYESLRSFDLAVAPYRQVTLARPNSRKAWLDYARVTAHTQVADYSTATQALRRAYRLKPESKAVQRRLSRLLARRQHWPEAWEIASGRAHQDPAVASLSEIASSGAIDPEFVRSMEARLLVEQVLELESSSTEIMCELLHLRLVASGAFRLGFGVKEELARHSLKSQLDPDLRQLGPVRETARKLAYLGRFGDACSLLEEAIAVAPGRSQAAALRKFRADVLWQSGDPSELPSVERYAASFGEIPGQSRFQSLIEGRRIAIVGPAEDINEHGDEIDAMDLVVRPKFVDGQLEGIAERVGSRTDISYYAGRDEQLARSAIGQAAASGALKMAVARPFMYRPGAPIWLRFYRADSSMYWGAMPLGIQRMIYDISRSSPDEIRVFGVDFFSAEKKFRDGYRDRLDHSTSGESFMNDIFAVHDLAQDFHVSAQLRSEGAVTFAPHPSEILDLGREGYLLRLEANGPF